MGRAGLQDMEVKERGRATERHAVLPHRGRGRNHLKRAEGEWKHSTQLQGGLEISPQAVLTVLLAEYEPIGRSSFQKKGVDQSEDVRLNLRRPPLIDLRCGLGDYLKARDAVLWQ